MRDGWVGVLRVGLLVLSGGGRYSTRKEGQIEEIPCPALACPPLLSVRSSVSSTAIVDCLPPFFNYPPPQQPSSTSLLDNHPLFPSFDGCPSSPLPSFLERPPP